MFNIKYGLNRNMGHMYRLRWKNMKAAYFFSKCFAAVLGEQIIPKVHLLGLGKRYLLHHIRQIVDAV